jgi:hypothetical protein
MNDVSVDQLLRDLAAELSVEPSCELAARVRARVDHRLERSALTASTLGVAFTLLVAALALTVSQDRPRERGAPARPISIATGGGAPTTAQASPHRGAGTATPPIVAGRLTRTPRPSMRAASAVPAAIASAGPKIIVPADQAIALQRILAAMRTGRSPVPPAAVVTLDADGRLPAPAQIEIPEITIERLWPPANGGGSRER